MRPEASSRFALLSLLLAIALLLHQLWWGGFEVRSLHFVVVVAALWTIARPGSVGRFAAMLGAEVVSVAREMPAVHSHTLMLAVCATSVLAFVALDVVRARRLPDAGALFERIAPFLRVSVLVLYAAAAVAKLNTGFLDPVTSCAAGMAAQVAWWDPGLLAGEEWMVRPAILGTLAVELSLPVLLAVPRLRVAGLMLGGAFHAVLALAGNVPFTALMLAFYVVFLPAGVAPRGLAGWRAPRWALPAMAGGWIAAAWLLDGRPELGRDLVEQGTRLAALALVGGGAVLLWRARPLRTTAAAAGGGLRLGHPVFAAGVAILVLNALSPYAGFKTESSFAMFSNLQTEPGRWNHVLVPERVRVLRYQEELVAIEATNDPALVRRTRGGKRLVRYELERYLRLRPAARAVYAGGPAETSAATPLLDKVAKFRDVRPVGRPGC